jgi:hypothetical protein
MGSGQHPPPDHATTTTATAADAGGYYFGPAIKCVAFGDERPAPTRDPASPHPTAPAGGPRAHADAEIDGRVYGLMVFRATRPEQMGEAREPDPPDYSMVT